MTGKSDLKEINSRLKLFISLSFALFLGVIESLPFFLENRQRPFSEIWLSALTWLIVFWGFWFLAINIVWRLDSKYSIINNKILKVLAIHLLMILGFTFSNAALSTVYFYDKRPEQPDPTSQSETDSTPRSPDINAPMPNYSITAIFIARFINSVPIVVLIYSGVWGIGIGLNYYQKYQERAIRTSELEAQLAHSQLQTLKTQLQPHFLFNTLNGIVGLIRNNENQAAIETISELSTLLRYVVENAGKEMVELKEEIEFNQLFLNLHQKRFSDRMRVEMHIAPETLHLEVPNLILQPLVENAVVHGIAKSIAQQRVIIGSRIENGYLKLTVKNDAAQLTDDWKLEKGVGLCNTFARLEKIYGGNYSLEIKNHENRFVIAEIKLPIKS